MSHFKWLLCLFGGARQSEIFKSAALESSGLDKLPVELVVKIASFLPPASLSSFALSCRAVYFALGTEHFKSLEEKSHCFEFLSLLAQDRPDDIACYDCKKFHAITRAEQHRSFSRLCRSIDWLLPYWRTNHALTSCPFSEGLSFTVFQMVMKRREQGLDYYKLLKLLTYKAFNPMDGRTNHYTALPRIFADTMLLREQAIVIVPLPSLIMSYGNLMLCRHVDFVWNPNSQWLEIRESDRHQDTVNRIYFEPQYRCRGLVRCCKHCFNDFSVEVKELDKKSLAIMITTWKDFGQGRSPMDPMWQQHLGTSEDDDMGQASRGSICNAFQEVPHVRFNSESILTKKEKKKLFGSRKYKDIVEYGTIP